MALLPISPLSPELPLVQPTGSSEIGLGPIANVGDGIPGIGGIGSVEMPGIGTITGPGISALTSPQITIPAPSPSSAPIVAQPSPEVTPFPIAGPAPSAAPSSVTIQQPSTITAPEQSSQTGATQTQTQSGGQLQQPQQGSPYSTPPITTTDIPSLITTPFTPQTSVPVKETPLAETFGKFLQDAATNYTDVQNQADDLIQRLATGQKVDLSDVSLALQKASITNSLAIQVRNKLVDAYQEIMRMQM